MKLAIVVLALAVVGAAAQTFVDNSDFAAWMGRHNKVYETRAEFQRRLANFRLNQKIVELQNLLDNGAVYSVDGPFADMHPEEFAAQYLSNVFDARPANKIVARPDASVTLADDEEFDWREKGAVTEVKNQGSCGSCWAFSTTGAIEGAWFVAKSELVSLSEQELVDCDKKSSGCNGGLMWYSFEEIIGRGGISSEESYPYKGRDGSCHTDSANYVAHLSSWDQLGEDEDELAKVLKTRSAIPIGINANNMQHYSAGIADPSSSSCSASGLNHGVLIVGFGHGANKAGDDTPFWIIKNSWGTRWGEQGYYRIVRGKGSCGLNRMCTIPVV